MLLDQAVHGGASLPRSIEQQRAERLVCLTDGAHRRVIAAVIGMVHLG
jgi:hypothetical protein